MRTKFNGILTLLLALFVQISFAQDKTISGTVSDESGPLPGVTVIKKGTTQGTETDFDGKYSLKAKTGDILVFSFVGMKDVERTIGSQNNIDILMENDNLLDEVIVTVAYSEKKKKDIIGAISVVTKEDIGEQKITTVTEALQGTAGLSLVNTSGQPGASPAIRIRGIGSLNGSSSPLIIVDGAQFTGNLNAINFNDVESYSVLKDADAVSLYGNRGANGVIIIKTKGGRDSNGKSVVTIDTSYGFSDKATSDYEYLSTAQILEQSWLASRNDFIDNNGLTVAQASAAASSGLVNLLKANPYSIAQPVGTDGKISSNAKQLYSTDWLDVLTQLATRQDASLSVRGGTDKTSYFVSGSFLDTKGYSLASKFKRYSGRLNVSTDVNKWLTIGANSFVTFSETNAPIQQGNRFSNNIQYVRSVSSIYPVYKRNPDGSFILDGAGQKQYDFAEQRGFFGDYNPVAETIGSPNLFERNTVNVSPNLEIRFNEDLTFSSQFNFSFYLFEGNIFGNPFVGPTPDDVINDTSSQKERSTTKSYNLVNKLAYKKTFNEKHNFSALLGQEIFENKYNFLRAQKNGFVFPELDELDNGNTATEARSFTNTNRLYSFFGRVDYNFNETYYLGASIRRDGSSRFIDDNKYGTFWSAAAGWSLYDQFFQDSNSINSLKLRASYGVVGNENIGQLFPYISEFGTGNNILGNGGIFPTTEGNPNLKWETHKKLNIGLDFGFLNNRINGSIEYYNNKIDDLIFLTVPQPSTGSGGDSNTNLAPFQNIAEISNKGFELTLNTTNVKTDDFKWTTSLSVSSNENKIESIPNFELQGSFRWEEGRDRYEFYMREWAGVDPGTGSPMWFKEVTDPTTGNVSKVTTLDYDDATRVYTGKSALPDFEGRFGTNFKYKDVDLGFNFNYKFGHYIYNTDYASLMKSRNPGEQLSADVLNHWSQPGDITDVPRQVLANDDFSARSTRWLQQGDYIRLKNVTLGYSLNQDLVEKFNLQSLRLYLTADNYWTWTKEDKLDDPEQSINGLTNNSSTVMKTIALGLNVSF